MRRELSVEEESAFQDQRSAQFHIFFFFFFTKVSTALKNISCKEPCHRALALPMPCDITSSRPSPPM